MLKKLKDLLSIMRCKGRECGGGCGAFRPNKMHGWFLILCGVGMETGRVAVWYEMMCI